MSNENHRRRRKCLLPGELEQMKREELSQKRRFRLLQVREQSKAVASDIRESVKKEKAKQLEKLKDDVLREKQEEKENELQNLKQQYYENLSELGSGWRAARNQAYVQEELKVKAHLNNIAASERGQQALVEHWKENALKKESSNSSLQARKFALEVEKERAAYIASLPPPKPDPVDALLESSGKPRAASDQKIMRADINVEKAKPEDELDACEAAVLETNKHQQMESEKAKLQQKRGVQMKSRFREAWKKKILSEECSRTLKDIETEERLARNETRQNYNPDENRYFMCSPLDKLIRKDKQTKAEDAFQKHFKAERDYEYNIGGEYSFYAIEKIEEDAEITDYIEPPMRKPCTSLLEPDFEEIDSRDDLMDELNVAYIESPEQKEAPKKMSEVEALSTLLVKLRKRRAELHDESERTVQLCLGVTAEDYTYFMLEELNALSDDTVPVVYEAGTSKEKPEIVPPKSVAVQAGKVFPPVSTGIQTLPPEETDIHERVALSSQKVQTDVERRELRVETAVQVDSDLEQHAVESVTTTATKESSSSTSYMSLPPQYGIPQFVRPAQTECDICDVVRNQASQAARGKYDEPLLVLKDVGVQPGVSRMTLPIQDTEGQKTAKTEVTQETVIKGTSELHTPEASSESFTSYMKRIMTKYSPAAADDDESGSETGVKTIFPPLDLSSTVKFVEPFSVVSPRIHIPSSGPEIGVTPAIITSPADQSIQSQLVQEQHDISDHVFVDGDEISASNLGILSATSENIRKGTVASEEIFSQLELSQKMLLSQFFNTPSADRDEALAKQLQECLQNLSSFKSRPPVTMHRVVTGEILMGHELSTIQEIDSVANGSSTDRVQNLSKSDIMSSSGTIQPLTPASHLDSSVADWSKRSGESLDTGSFPEAWPTPQYDAEARSQKDVSKRQHPYSESFQPLSSTSLQISDEKSDGLNFVASSSESLHSPSVTEIESGHVASHVPATSDFAAPVGTVVYKGGIIQIKEVQVSKISHEDSSALSFHISSSDYDSSIRTAQHSLEKDDSKVSEFLHTQKLEVHQQVDSTLHPFVPAESGSRFEHSPAHDVKVTYGETSSGPYQLMSLKTDSSIVTDIAHGRSKQILQADRSSGSFQPMSTTVEDSQMSSVTLPKIVVSDHNVPATSILLEGDEQNHFASSLQSDLVSTKIQQPSVSSILTSTKKDGGESLPSTAESPIIRGPQFGPSSPLFHKPSVSDSGGSFHQMQPDLSSFTAASSLRTVPTQVSEDRKISEIVEVMSLPSTSTKKDGDESLPSMAEGPIIHDPQFGPSASPLFHKPSVSYSGGSFYPMKPDLSSFTAASSSRTVRTQVSEDRKNSEYFSEAVEAASLPSSPHKVTKMRKPSETDDQYRHFHQVSQPSNLAKMVLQRNTSSSSGSISSSQESLISAFTDSKITHQSTPVKARQAAVQDAGILEEPDLTLIGSEISRSMNTTPRRQQQETVDDTMTEESIAPPSILSSAEEEMPLSSLESVEQKRDPDSGSEAGRLSAVSDNMMIPISDYSVVVSPVSASLLSFEKHESEFAVLDDVSPSVPPCSSNLEFHKELPNKSSSGHRKQFKRSVCSTVSVQSQSKTPTVLSHRTESNFSRATSSQNSTPTTATPTLRQKSSTDYKSRTKRLWNNLAEVKEKKLTEEKKQAFVKNREKVKELQMKIQRGRKMATPKK